MIKLVKLKARDYERKIRNLLIYDNPDTRKKAEELLEQARKDSKIHGNAIHKLERLFERA